MKNSHLKVLALFFFLVALFHLSLSIYEGNPEIFLWICATSMLILAIGLYYKNLLIISSVITTTFIIELLWTTDMISFILTGGLVFGIASYLFDVSTIRFILTFYHFFLLIIPIYVILKLKDFHKRAWIFSSAHLLVVSLLTIFLTKSDVNCVRNYCNLGIFNFVYVIKPLILPFLIFHWVGLTLIIFIPTNTLFYYIIKKIKNRK